ncbi:elongin-A-like [Antechinus flavipes]|uniref:elongin-A-like n=1 Tax=Antechinus flavipes TaxID=38775 RepID=UPI002235A9A7|nr:elongin-A-like [Antechinus flavipes]
METPTTTSSLGDPSTSTLATMASAREAGMREAVEQLQAGLLWLPHPDKVLKYMKRLHDLPMTVNVLAETGIGKLVNSLCKYEEVGAMARNIVGRWKTLVSAEEDFDSDSDPDLVWEEQSFERSRSRKRPHAISKEDDFQKMRKSSSSQPPSPSFGEKKHPKLWEAEKSLRASSASETQEGRKECDQRLPSDHPSSGQVQSQPSDNCQQLHTGHFSLQAEKAQKSGKGSDPHIQDKGKPVQESQLGEPSQVKPRSLNDGRRHKSVNEKEKCLLDFERQKKTVTSSREKVSATSKEVGPKPSSSGTDTKEKQSSALRADKDKESCSVKKSFPPKETHFVKHISKTKHLDTPTSKPEKNQTHKDPSDVGKSLKDKKVSHNVQIQEGKSKPPKSDKSTEGSLLQSVLPEPCDKDEQPTTSDGSNSSIAGQTQRNSSVKIPNVVREDEGHNEDDDGAKTDDSKSPDSVRDLSKSNNGRLNKEQSAMVLAKLRSITSRITPRSGNTSVPTVQESSQPTDSETSLPSKPKKKKTSSYHEEEGVGFTGRRMNSKMQVYSGPKCVYQPRLISLHQQCIRVLNNNLDSIFDIGNVPYTVLEPVLEKCTPKQLHRIEGYNHLLIGETDQLWKIHCNRDFKKERPKESESWRELYLRLQEAREQRLLLLTENIRSAHANKPKGRQTMMAFVNSVAKPPRDIRKKQEKFGTGRAAITETSKTKPALHPPASRCNSNDVQTSAGPSTSSIHSTSSAGSSGSCDSRKTPGKKIAPMMAKTIKAFKNRFSR